MSDLPDRPPEDADVETHRARIQAAVEQYVASLKFYMDELWKKYQPQTRYWTGRCTALNTSAKTATVDLDPLPEGGSVPGTTCGWGRKTWTAAQLVGKPVRIMIDTTTKAMWIDDVLA